MITNWHNVAGRHPTTNRILNNGGRLPTFIEAKLASYQPEGMAVPDGSFTTSAHRIELYTDSLPIWFEHPTLFAACDVVAIPADRPSTCPVFMHNAANCISTDRIPVEPGGLVFIIGFPQGISVGFGLPIWKSGYIGSEPHYDIMLGGDVTRVGGLRGGMALPAFFVDALTREGMSGSPVFAAYVGTWDMSDPYSKFDPETPGFWNRSDFALFGKGMEFIGCYSGRLPSKEMDAALGLCWKASVLDTICASAVVGKHPHVTEEKRTER